MTNSLITTVLALDMVYLVAFIKLFHFPRLRQAVASGIKHSIVWLACHRLITSRLAELLIQKSGLIHD